MPAWAKRVGLPVARRLSGVKARSLDATTSHRSRPSGLLPSEIIARFEEAAASLRNHATVSS